MIENLINFLQVYVLPLGVFGVFLASVIEEVVAPIPSALIMTMSGFIFVSGGLSLDSISNLVFKVAGPAAFGVSIGSLLVYFAAQFGGRFIIERWGKYIGLFVYDIEKLQNRLQDSKKDEFLIIGARILPFIPSVAISAFCGIIGMKVSKYLLLTLLGTFVRGLILGTIGWQVGNIYKKYADVISSIENILLLSTIFIITAFIVLKYKGKLGSKNPP